MDDVSTQVQPVDTCRVEIKQAANGTVQVSTRATDRATDEEAERTVMMAVKMFEAATAKLGM